MRELKNEDSSALNFGSSIHKGLEHWYQLPLGDRELSKAQRERADLMAYGHGIEEPQTGALESIRQFVVRGWQGLSAVPEGDKRSLSNGISILANYFKHYANDGFEVYRDSNGPCVEREVSFTMYDSDELRIDYFGTIDVILHNKQTGIITVTDHKTTSALGQEFYNRCKPNFQYTGYVLAAKKALGLDTNLFMINGLQVAKTKAAFARQITERTEEDFAELQAAVLHNVQRWLAATREYEEHKDIRAFPMTAPNPCSMYGGCSYLRVCEVGSKLKENVIKSMWPNS